MSGDRKTNLKMLPSVDRLIRHPLLADLIQDFGHNPVRDAVRVELDQARASIRAAPQEDAGNAAVGEDEVVERVRLRVNQRFSPAVISVFNLTGTVIHTNLGRASMPSGAIAAMARVAGGPVALEYDLEQGRRGDREQRIEALLCEITGAEAATVVNNNAAAVVLVLTTLAVNREVLISRGELVEIGGAFRIPEVMGSAGCRLKEVGATNRTHLQDFARAIDQRTALIMKVHTSNYEIVGYTQSVPEVDLARLAHDNNLPFVSDLGSGTLLDLGQFGLPREPTVTEALQHGADLVTFSGDKLLGGPQAGLIVGKREMVEALKANPLKRALRVDKVTLAALAEVLRLYLDPATVAERLPLLRDLTRPLAEIRAVAELVLPALRKALTGLAEVDLVPCKSQIGSGALPVERLESAGVAITPLDGRGGADAGLQALARAFRKLPIPVIGRLHDGRLIFDFRCLYDTEEFSQQLRERCLEIG